MHQSGSISGTISRGWVAGLVVAAVSIAGLSTATAEQPTMEAVDNLHAQIDTLEETYLMPAVLDARFRAETRFNEAKVACLLEDYERASLMLATLVDTQDGQQFESYDEALYLLGDSLFEVRNFRAARGYFRRVVDKGDGEFYQPAIVKLLELAGQIDDYEGVDELYDRLDDLEDVSAAIHYIRGKTLFKEERYASARPWLQRAAHDDDYELTARYFEGVTVAASGELGEADEIFEELTQKSVDDEQGKQLVELAHLARGRLAYEVEDYHQAIDHYLQLPRTSPHFTRALYELTWAHVAQQNYRAALRNLDILLISEPDPQFVPEAKTLMADMAMRLGEYEDAREWFEELIETFTPVRDELTDFIDEHQELDEFFVELVRDELRGLRPDFLPDKVTEWLEDDQLMKASRQLMADGVTTQEDIDAAYEAIDELEAAIDMGSSIEAFPQLAEGWAQGHELESRLVALQEQLLDWELQRVQPFMGAEQQQRLAELEEELEELQRLEQRAPATQQELEERDRQIQEQFQILSDEVDQVAFEIEGLKQTLEGIGEYMRSEADQMSSQERNEVAEIRQELRSELEDLEEERRQLSRALDQTRRSFGTRDESLVEHRQIRDDIQKLQAERAELVDATTTDLSPREEDELLEVAEIRRRLPELEERLDEYFDEIDELVEEQMSDIRVTLEAERRELANYQAELDTWMEDTEESVAEVAMHNFMAVHHDFDRLLGRSHLGLVDVDWQQLEDARHERQELEEDKRETENMLREAFPDVH